MRDELKTAISGVKNAMSDYHKESAGYFALKQALTELRNIAKSEEDTETIADRIGNCYIPHLNRTENDFEQGYNSAIRDVLDILLKRGRTNG